jgi:microcystin-dependent protein
MPFSPSPAEAAGTIKAWGGGVIPAGWLRCDGAVVSRTTYAALFSALGTAYGAGDGSTTFGLPDYRGRSVIGAGTGSGLTARSRGQSGGAEVHVLAESEMPSHTHDERVYANAVGVTLGYDTNAGSGTGLAHLSGSQQGAGSVIATAARGGGGPHANMQPWGCAEWIIKV